MSEPTVDRDPFEFVAESFLARYRAGQRPSVEDYAARYPELAEQIRELLPALVMVEQDLSIEPDPGSRGAQPPPIPSPGNERRLGDYLLLREIGRGGMGVVYEAEQVSLGRRVALKVLSGHVSGDRLAQERFRREARSAARLHHTNIVPVFEVGQAEDVCFYAMQFIQGQGLDAVITELRRLRDRAGFPSQIEAASGGRSLRPRREQPRQGIEAPTLSEGVEVSAVLQYILTGRLDPGDRGPELAGASSSVLARSLAGSLATPPGTATESRALESNLALTSTETDRAAAGDTTGPRLGHPSTPSPSPSASPSSTSTILPGGTQLSSVESGRRRFYRSLAQIGRQVAGGLAYAHARGIVHRDIKPSNLLLDTEGVVWIADFGLAKAEDEGLTQSGDILGTLRYMAPERFRGEGDARADVYALGLTLYELLTLRAGFDTSDRLRLIEQIKTEEPLRPRALDARVPRDLETIVLKAIEKDPRARYQTAEAMGEDLGRFLADEPIRARQVTPAERYWRWARRNPVIAILGGVLTAVLIATTVGSSVAATYFRNLAGSESRANQQSQEAQKIAVKAQDVAERAQKQALLERDNSRRQSAGLALDKGIALAQEGHADRGLLWMLEALKTVPDDAEEFRNTVRWNLGAWLGQVHKALRIIDTGRLNELAFSPDGRSFAMSYAPLDRSRVTPIDLWDTASGRKLSTFPSAFAPFAFRPDGKVLVAYADLRRMVAIDLNTRRVLWTSPTLTGENGLGIAFSADSSTVLATRQRPRFSNSEWLLRLDAVTGQQRGEPMSIWGIQAVAPDGTKLAVDRIENGVTFIDVLDLPSRRRKASWRTGGHGNSGLVFSPDGKSLFVSRSAGDIFDTKSSFSQIWDAGTGQPTSLLMAATYGAIYAPSGDRLLTRTDFQCSVRDAATGRERGSRLLFGGSSALHPDGRTVLTTTLDDTSRLWQVSADAEPLSNDGTDKNVSMTGSATYRRSRGFNTFRGGRLRADGKIALLLVEEANGRELIRSVDPTTGRSFSRPAPHYPGWIVRSVAFSPDGRSFATGSNPYDRVASEVRLWDTATGRLLLPPMPHTNWAAALAFQPDGKVLAAGDYHGLVRTWDTSNGKEIGRPLPQGELVTSLAYSPDGNMLAVGLATDRTRKPGTRLWNTRTSQPIGDLLPSVDTITRIEFRPDGRALLAGTDHSTRLWDTTQGRALSEPIIEEQAGGFHPDGRAFLTVGRDGAIKLRDAATGAALTTLLACPSPATCATFRGDGGLVAAGFADGTVRLCDPATKQPVGPPRLMRHAVQHLTFTFDGRSVAAIDELGESCTWPVPEPLLDQSLDDLTLRIEARTGLRMETGLAISRLDASAWRERLEQLNRLDPTALLLDDGPAWHEPMVREAEQNGNAFAAIWHLDRLIAAKVDDWFLYARRARAWSRSDQFDKAATDYRQAERLGSRERVLDFQTHCVVECTRSGRWSEALWYLDRLIAARPDDGSLHEDRAAVYGKLGREADRQAELARVFELGADEGLVIPRAEELGRAGRWAEAAGLLTRCGRTGPLSQELAQAWGIACLKAGDHAGYREACAAFMACQGPNPTVVWNELSAASLFALGAEGLNEYQVPVGWFQARLSAVPAPRTVIRHLFSNALGGLLLRAGRLDEAIVRVNEGIVAAKEVEMPSDWAYLAMAHAKKGNLAEARRWLDRLRAARPDSSASFWDLQELALLRSEAESWIIDAKFPGDPFALARTISGDGP